VFGHIFVIMLIEHIRELVICSIWIHHGLIIDTLKFALDQLFAAFGLGLNGLLVIFGPAN
jgi:hypothetical protein